MSKKYDGLLLLSDLDGTLLTRESKVTEENLKALEHFMANGGRFAIATGRNANTARPVAKIVKPNVPSICYNGSLLYDFANEKAVRSINLKEDAIKIVQRVFTEDPEISIEINKDNEIYVLNSNPSTDYHMAVVKGVPHYINTPADIGFPWVKIGFWAEPDVITEFYSKYKELAKDDFTFIRSHELSYELLSREADKGIMLNAYRELYKGCKIIACGDNENDALMLKNADLSFAPKNAFKSAINPKTEVLDTDCNNSFIAEVISKL